MWRVVNQFFGDNKYLHELEHHVNVCPSLNDLAMTFLNLFQLPMRYDASTELLSIFQQDKATHISDHIQELRRWKRFIKEFIPQEFLLEWFLNFVLPYIAKDVSTSRMQNEEQAIFRAHQMDLIYAQSGILYEIIPNTPRSIFNAKFKTGSHVDGIVGSASAKPAESVTNQMNKLSINQPMLG